MLQYTAGILDLTSTREEIYFLQAFDMFQIKPLIIQIEEKFKKKKNACSNARISLLHHMSEWCRQYYAIIESYSLK